MTTILHDAALLVTAAGLGAATIALARTRQILLSITLLLDFFSAASLLRIAGPPTWSVLVAAALTITIRQLSSRGLRAAQGSGSLRFVHERSWASNFLRSSRHR